MTTNDEVQSTSTQNLSPEELLRAQQVERTKADLLKATQEVKLGLCSFGSLVFRTVSTIAQSVNIASEKGSEVLQTAHDKLDEIHRTSSLNK